MPRLMVKVVRNFLRDMLSAPAASTNGLSGAGGGSIAGRATARMAWFSIQWVTRLKMRGGTRFSRNAIPPEWPT